MKLQEGILYGPVLSRRFGRSLGVNLLPSGRKVCNFDCVYCQYGDRGQSGKGLFPSLYDIAAAFEDFAARPRARIDQITIAGNGEPTLYPDFPAAVDLLVRLRDRYFSGVPLTILSNSSTCHDRTVRRALGRLDVRVMKLDAGDLQNFVRVNMPSASVSWPKLVGGLRALKDVVLQSLFVSGPLDNTLEPALRAWMRAVSRIRPSEVQIYTFSRLPRETALRPAPQSQLMRIAERLIAETGVQGVVIP